MFEKYIKPFLHEDIVPRPSIPTPKTVALLGKFWWSDSLIHLIIKISKTIAVIGINIANAAIPQAGNRARSSGSDP